MVAKCTKKRGSMGEVGDLIALQCFIACLQSNINYCKILRVELGICDNEAKKIIEKTKP